MQARYREAAILVAVVTAAALLGAASAAGAATSPFFGVAGELWKPTGPFMDFSYAGYHQSDDPIPSPNTNLTRSLVDFRGPGITDTQAMLNMVAWANQQPARAGWVVITIPAGTYTLERPVNITRSKTVLRGAGKDNTTLYLPNSLRDLYGPADLTKSPYIFVGGFIRASGTVKRTPLAKVTTPAGRGLKTLQVDSTAKLRVGDRVALVYKGGNFALAREIMNNQEDPGTKYRDFEAKFSSKVQKINGKFVTLERELPLAVKPAFQPELVHEEASVTEVGIEGFTMKFKYAKYRGHHLEDGYSGIELWLVQDCWVRDIGLVNVDNGILVSASDRITVTDITLSVTASRVGREPTYDGHWGVRIAWGIDILVENFKVYSMMLHAVGSDGHGMFSVFKNGWARDGNLELHRAQAAQILFTDIDLGRSSCGFCSGGPPTSGPSSGAWTTFWNIRSNSGKHGLPDNNSKGPGDCNYGPNLNFIGVTFTSRRMCRSWVYQPGSISPANLFDAQLAYRKQQAR